MKEELVVRGAVYAGRCARRECVTGNHARWFNRSTCLYYCRHCARWINEEHAKFPDPLFPGLLCVRAFRVAVVDDSEQHRDLMARSFKREGCLVISIDHPIGASHAAAVFGAEVVIVDYDMPMKGTGVLQTVRKLLPQALRVLHTSKDEVLRPAALECSADLAFSKSKAFDEVIAEIRGRLEER